MKKIILLVIIVFAIPTIIIEDTDKNYIYYNDNYPDLPKDEKWEYVKERIFTGFSENVLKYKGPILCELFNATSKDSLVVNMLLEDLKTVLPNKKIDYFKNYTGIVLEESNTVIKKESNDEEYSINGYKISDLKKVTIRLHFEESEMSDPFGFSMIENAFKMYDEKQTFYEARSHKISGIFQPKYHYVFSDSSSLKQRKIEIQRDLIRTISCASFFRHHEDKIIHSKTSILNNKESVLIGSELSQLDEFLLQKLYSSNLLEEFKAYMFKTYPWRYASNYLSKAKTKFFAIWLNIILTIVLFILGFGLLYKKQYKQLYFSYFIPILYVLISALYVYKFYNYITVPSGFEHWRQYISIHVLFVMVTSLIALFLMLFDKYFIKSSMNFVIQIISKMSFTFLICIIPTIAISFLEGHIQSKWLHLNPIFLVTFGFALGRGLLLYLENFSESLIKQKDVELSKLKEVNAQAEVKLLQSQINPHFLYNALNSIASLATIDTVKTEKMALSLSDLFKYTINRKGKKNSTIGDEVDMVKNYLEVEQIRFGDRLKFHIEVDKSLENIKIPMFLIQPLIENAVKHGISKIEGEGEVKLVISKKQSNVMIRVIDNGPQFPDGLVSGHGLQTVYDLLRLSYGDNAALSWENIPEKRITITINSIA